MTNNRAPELVIAKMMFDGRKPVDLRSPGVDIWDHRSIGIWDHRSIREEVGLRDAQSREFRYKSILLDITHPCPQAQRYLRGGSVDWYGSAAAAAAASELRKRQCYARPGQVSFDEWSHNVSAFEMESVRRLPRGI